MSRRKLATEMAVGIVIARGVILVYTQIYPRMVLGRLNSDLVVQSDTTSRAGPGLLGGDPTMPFTSRPSASHPYSINIDSVWSGRKCHGPISPTQGIYPSVWVVAVNGC